MPAGGRIVVSVARADLDDEGARRAGVGGAGAYVRVSVADTGVGIDRDVQPRVFEPFFTTKPFGKGTGLGLSIAYGVLKQHHGAIGVESEPGKGATFTFLLPLLADADAGVASPAPAGPGRGATAPPERGERGVGGT
jgi:two-component system, cell cycle sensor histidine kinase and response regulator CckA